MYYTIRGVLPPHCPLPGCTLTPLPTAWVYSHPTAHCLGVLPPHCLLPGCMSFMYTLLPTSPCTLYSHAHIQVSSRSSPGETTTVSCYTLSLHKHDAMTWSSCAPAFSDFLIIDSHSIIKIMSSDDSITDPDTGSSTSAVPANRESQSYWRPSAEMHKDLGHGWHHNSSISQ